MHAILGSPYYVAPEVLLATKPTPSETGLVLPPPEPKTVPTGVPRPWENAHPPRTSLGPWA